ncbi:hypothetical protein [Phenylobacterium sp.]|uniref:hypothetical protein n=1 Tax=Phenylobacterium sp. TaxID=1871053 RepID=UPI00261E00C1|nr:hypothetical protein [Phenylobacterium sp.]
MGGEIKPLNGTVTHPLSAHAKAELRSLLRGARPCSEINPGVVNRLRRGGLAEVVDLPSPYTTNRGQMIGHLCITNDGRLVAEASDHD